MQAKHHNVVARLRDEAESELTEIRRKVRQAPQAPLPQLPVPLLQGPNDARTQRIYQIWQTHRNLNSRMAKSLRQDTTHNVAKPQTREQYIEELSRQGKEHLGLKVNQPYVVEAQRGLNAAKANCHMPTPQPRPYRLPRSVARRMAAAATGTATRARSPPPYLRPLPSPIPYPSPPPQPQTRDEIRSGLGNKRIKLVAGNFTSPPPLPPRAINRGGLVNLPPMCLLPMRQMQQVRQVRQLSTTATAPVTGSTSTVINTPGNGHHTNGHMHGLEESIVHSLVTATTTTTATATAGTPRNDNDYTNNDDEMENEDDDNVNDETDTGSS